MRIGPVTGGRWSILQFNSNSCGRLPRRSRLVVPFAFSPHHKTMLFKTRSAAVYGIEAYVVDVEVNISTGESGKFYISGLPDAAVRESRSRIIASIRNNGFTFPYQAITVNLAPADVKKGRFGFRSAAGRWYSRRPRLTQSPGSFGISAGR